MLEQDSRNTLRKKFSKSKHGCFLGKLNDKAFFVEVKLYEGQCRSCSKYRIL